MQVFWQLFVTVVRLMAMNLESQDNALFNCSLFMKGIIMSHALANLCLSAGILQSMMIKCWASCSVDRQDLLQKSIVDL